MNPHLRFWVKKTDRNGRHLNEIAKAGNVEAVTQLVNGGQNGYADRVSRFNAVATILGIGNDC